MVVDGLGVRAAHQAGAYAAWQAVLTGTTMPLVYAGIRRSVLPLPRGKPGALVVLAALFGLFGYCAAIWAMSRAPMGQVSALRETSILFAALIGAVMLKERITIRKIVGAVAMTVGIGLLAVG
jgi:drug/metabolite transporter (DMT)-like permease